MSNNYIPTTWIGAKTVGTADVMNNIEQGISGAHDRLDGVDEKFNTIVKNVVKIIGKNNINESSDIQKILDNQINNDLVFEGVFNLKTPLIINNSYSNIDCTKAIFYCKGDGGVQGISDLGGGFILNGNEVVLNGGKFYGHKKPQGNIENSYARSIVVIGNKITIKNSYFEDGNGGAIELRGSYNSIQYCKFVNCNNHPVDGGDYGSIQISNSSFNTILNNDIQGQYYSGICSYGESSINNIIKNNYIKADKGASNTSMGIFCLMGSGDFYVIDNNTIENVTAEGIMFAGSPNKTICNIKITNNTIKNCDFKCLSFENVSALGFKNLIIQNNILYINDNSHGIVLDRVFDSNINSNIINGVSRRSINGILLQDSPSNLIIDNNSFLNFQVGIGFSGEYCFCKNNIIKDCDLGIKTSYSNTSVIENNFINNCIEGIKTQSDWFSSYTTLRNNTILNCQNGLIGLTQLYSNYKTSNETNVFIKGKLNNGKSIVTYYHVKQGNSFIVCPTSNGNNDNHGSVYIDFIDHNNSLLTIKSTNANDDRDFVVIKIMD